MTPDKQIIETAENAWIKFRDSFCKGRLDVKEELVIQMVFFVGYTSGVLLVDKNKTNTIALMITMAKHVDGISAEITRLEKKQESAQQTVKE